MKDGKYLPSVVLTAAMELLGEVVELISGEKYYPIHTFVNGTRLKPENIIDELENIIKQIKA